VKLLAATMVAATGLGRLLRGVARADASALQLRRVADGDAAALGRRDKPGGYTDGSSDQ